MILKTVFNVILSVSNLNSRKNMHKRTNEDYGHFPFNLLTTNVPHYVETSQLICNANQLTGFYLMGNIGC